MTMRELPPPPGTELSPTQRQKLLAKIPLLRGFPRESLIKLSVLAQEVHIDRGWTICQWFDPQTACYVIVRGEVNVFDANGEKTIGPNSILNQESLLDEESQANKRVTSLDADLLKLSKTDFVTFLSHDPVAKIVFTANKVSQKVVSTISPSFTPQS